MIQKISCCQPTPTFCAKGAKNAAATAAANALITSLTGSDASVSARFLAAKQVKGTILPVLEQNPNLKGKKLAKALQAAIAGITA